MSGELLYPRIVHLLGAGRGYCECPDEGDWEIEPERGRCRVCGLEVDPLYVRRMQAITQSRIARYDATARRWAAMDRDTKQWTAVQATCPKCGRRYVQGRPEWTTCLRCEVKDGQGT